MVRAEGLHLAHLHVQPGLLAHFGGHERIDSSARDQDHGRQRAEHPRPRDDVGVGRARRRKGHRSAGPAGPWAGATGSAMEVCEPRQSSPSTRRLSGARPPVFGRRRAREDFPQDPEPAVQAAARRRIERRQHLSQVRLGAAGDPIQCGAAGRRDLDQERAPVLFGRRPANPAAIRHRADRARHRRQADALQGRQLGQRARMLDQARRAGRSAPAPAARRPSAAPRRRCA